MPFVAAPVVLDDAARVTLEQRANAATSSVRDAKRARVILLAAQGVSSAQISGRVGMHESNVAKWRQRFLKDGLAGLDDVRRPGRPLVYGPDDRTRIVAIATSQRDETDPESAWTHEEIAREAGVGISASQVGRILAGLDLKPHKVRGWLNRRDDPDFWERVEDVCGVYLSPPQNAIVLSVDEKTGIQAKERCAPTTPAAPGRPPLEEFEYVRHGTVSLLAALDVHTGEVSARHIDRNDAVTFIDFLEHLDRIYSNDIALHLVLDNGSSHAAKATRRWLADHPRFVVHWTPKHASWLNQVEIVFSILARKVLKRGNFDSQADLVSKIMRFVIGYNRTAKPFAWTYTGRPLTHS